MKPAETNRIEHKSSLSREMELEMVEQLGSGIPRILQTYGRECFHFSGNFLRMVSPAIEKVSPRDTPQDTPQVTQQVGLVKGLVKRLAKELVKELSESQIKILNLIEQE